jgi:hypothetical protein
VALIAAGSEPVANCTATEHLDDAAMTASSVYGSGAGPADTPIVNGTLIWKKGGAVLAVDAVNESSGSAVFNGAVSGGFANADTTIGKAFYSFNTQQTYSNAVGTNDLNGLRAKVTSTSDSTGEWISIIETSGEGAANNVEEVLANDSSVFVGLNNRDPLTRGIGSARNLRPETIQVIRTNSIRISLLCIKAIESLTNRGISIGKAPAYCSIKDRRSTRLINRVNC